MRLRVDGGLGLEEKGGGGTLARARIGLPPPFAVFCLHLGTLVRALRENAMELLHHSGISNILFHESLTIRFH